MKVIEVVISTRGETTIQTKNFTGEDCQHASKWIENALGTKITDHKTPEFYSTATQQNEVKA